MFWHATNAKCFLQMNGHRPGTISFNGLLQKRPFNSSVGFMSRGCVLKYDPQFKQAHLLRFYVLLNPIQSLIDWMSDIVVGWLFLHSVN